MSATLISWRNRHKLARCGLPKGFSFRLWKSVVRTGWAGLALVWAGAASAMPINVRIDGASVYCDTASEGWRTQIDLFGRNYGFVRIERPKIGTRDREQELCLMPPFRVGWKRIIETASNEEGDSWPSISHICSFQTCSKVFVLKFDAKLKISQSSDVWKFFHREEEVAERSWCCSDHFTSPRMFFDGIVAGINSPTEHPNVRAYVDSWCVPYIMSSNSDAGLYAIFCEHDGLTSHAYVNLQPSSVAGDERITSHVGRSSSGVGRYSASLISSDQKNDLSNPDKRQNESQDGKNGSKEGRRISDKLFHEWLIEFAGFLFCVIGGLTVCAVGLMVLVQGDKGGEKA